MPLATRQAIINWAAAAFIFAATAYSVGYISLGKRIEIIEGGQRWSSLDFRSEGIAATYLPLGMIEAAARQRAVVLSAESDIQWISWTCRPLEFPDKLVMPPRSELQMSP